jgi:hypothetical protein
MFFSGKSRDYDLTLRIAEEASGYARSVILKGASQLENNELSPPYFQHLLRGVEGVRYTKSKEIGMRDIIYDEVSRHMKMGESEVLATYKSVIEVSRKYSVGNCFELTFQALDYILNRYPEIKAEVYKLEYGEHTFLVLNRDADSSMFEPDTWGKNAIVCDPFANEVYPAKECIKRLRSSIEDDKENKTVPYDPNQHLIMPFENYNTWTIREEITNEKMKQVRNALNKK